MADKKKSSTSKASKASAKDVARARKVRPGKASADGKSPNLDKKLARVIGKRVRKLEGKLTQASKLERKRLRALESARRRRQLIEAALDELRKPTAKPPKARSESAASSETLAHEPDPVPAGDSPAAEAVAPAIRSTGAARPRAPRRTTSSTAKAPATATAPATAARTRRAGTKTTPKPEG
jgi:hypothetical protein